MEETAYAKINLALHVRGREVDGYHRIETLFAFAEHGDRLSAEPAKEVTLRTTGPFADDIGPYNLVLRAADMLRERSGVSAGAALALEKNLPVTSGIGGGSADAAAALRLLARLWNVEEDLFDLAQSLGADVAACLRSEVARGEGRGDLLAFEDGSGLAGMPLLLVNPGIPLPTAKVFAAWDGEDRGPLPMASPLATALDGRNDLEAPARSFVPEIGEVLAALNEREPVHAHMSGSGATCFALFAAEQDRDEAFEAISAQHPGWWQLKTRLR